jgi:hypothetical protein
VEAAARTLPKDREKTSLKTKRLAFGNYLL